MKVYALLLSLTVSITSSLAELPDLSIDQFQGDYRSPSGSGFADTFNLPAPDGFAQSKNITIRIEKTQTGYNLTTPDHLYDWSDAPSVLMDLETAQWSGVKVSSYTQEFLTAADSLSLNDKTQQLSFNDFFLNCKLITPSHSTFTHTLLEACLNGQTSLKLKYFKKFDKTKGAPSLYQDLMMALTPYEIAPLAETLVENVGLSIKDQSFKAELTTKVVFNTTVKMNGKIYYQNEKNQIRLRLDSARAGFLNVLSKVFDQLEKNQSEKLIVQRPWVTIILSEE